MTIGRAYVWGTLLGIFACHPFLGQNAPPPTQLTLVLTDGTQVSGTISQQDADVIVIITNSFLVGRSDSTQPNALAIRVADVASCTVNVPGDPAITVGARSCTTTGQASPPITSGLVAASIAPGFVDSAQRDVSVKAGLTAAIFERVQKSTGQYHGKLFSFLSFNYDDKWKAKPLSSNVTQVYQGLLQQSFYRHRTPSSSCEWDNFPLSFDVIASAYHNNGQGIVADHSYGFGFSRDLAIGTAGGRAQRGCDKLQAATGSRLDLKIDARSINYFLYPPGDTLHGIGTQISVGYSHTFKSLQIVSLTVAGEPVFNDTRMSQAKGDFEYIIPFHTGWTTKLEFSDNYYEVAPKTFNKNYANVSFGVVYKPVKSK